MATATRVLTAAVSGTVFTTNNNSALEALDTCHAGTSAPSDEVANGKLWLDTTTTPGILKIFDNAVWSAVISTADVTTAGALMDSEVDADIKTLVLPASTTISTYGASLVDDASATAARSTLGLGTVATTAATAYATAAQGTLADAALPTASAPTQSTATWEAGTDTTASRVTAANVKAAIIALGSTYTQPTTVGAVGTYAWLRPNATGQYDYMVAGTDYAGSALTFSAIQTSVGNAAITMINAAPSGTWRSISSNYAGFSGTTYRSGLYLRIS